MHGNGPSFDPDAGRRSALARCLGHFAPTRWSIAARTAEAQASAVFRCERLTLRSTDGSTARAYLTGPSSPWLNLPAMIYCHAHGNRHAIGASELVGGRPALIDPPYAVALAEAGFVALCLDLPCFGERASESESAAAKRHLWRGTTLFGQMLSELAGLVDVLGEIGGVDTDRIGAMGISMGATLSFWLAALDTRIAAVAQLCCFADLATLVNDGAHDLHGIYMTVPGLLGTFSTGEIAGMAAPRPQLVCIGTDDPLTPPGAVARAAADAQAAYGARGAGAAFELIAQDGVGHKETTAIRSAVLRFLVAALGGQLSGPKEG